MITTYAAQGARREKKGISGKADKALDCRVGDNHWASTLNVKLPSILWVSVDTARQLPCRFLHSTAWGWHALCCRWRPQCGLSTNRQENQRQSDNGDWHAVL